MPCRAMKIRSIARVAATAGVPVGVVVEGEALGNRLDGWSAMPSCMRWNRPVTTRPPRPSCWA